MKSKDEIERRLKSLAVLLDSKFQVPGTSFRIGWDAALGLIPGIGDLISTLFALYFFYEALRLRAPASVLLRILSNIAVDSGLGAVPIAGDLFDAAWKANQRNAGLLLEYCSNPKRTQKESRLKVGLILACAVALLACVAYSAWRLIGAVISLL
ncbi:MAG: DUF4112 domain-containing protein [Bdellovibrionota bacterium]